MKTFASLCILIGLAACTTIRPKELAEQPQLTAPVFTHELLDRVLQRFVDARGRVDYTGLQNRTGDLERYYQLLSTYSPDSHPELFPTQQSRLAYWINAYNAAVLKAVLSHYPISSVADVKAPALFFFLPAQSGFFVFQRLVFGAESMSLYSLENDIVRSRFAEPRIHFALNCASRGCPRLPASTFKTEHLDEELDRETRNFVAEERNFRLDHAQKTIFLSSIFQWYESDFLDWYKDRFPDRRATLLDYVSLYLPDERAAQLDRAAASYQVEFIPYDWTLNDQHIP